jgi:hypothetical protein
MTDTFDLYSSCKETVTADTDTQEERDSSSSPSQPEYSLLD